MFLSEIQYFYGSTKIESNKISPLKHIFYFIRLLNLFIYHFFSSFHFLASFVLCVFSVKKNLKNRYKI